MTPIQSIGIIGYGNVAYQLAEVLFEKGLALDFIAGRNNEPVKVLADKYDLKAFDINETLPSVDLIILAVSDDSIKEIDLDIPQNTLVCHNSGSKSISDITHPKKGVFYALQTFTKDKTVDWNKVPFLIEAESKEDENKLIQLAKNLSEDVRVMNSKQRKTLHLSAVLSCNFANYFWTMAEKICIENDIDFSLLHPLIIESSSKILDYSPADIQTGPAKRNDQNTINEHIELLNNHPDLANLYSMLSKMIQKEFE